MPRLPVTDQAWEAWVLTTNPTMREALMSGYVPEPPSTQADSEGLCWAIRTSTPSQAGSLTAPQESRPVRRASRVHRSS